MDFQKLIDCGWREGQPCVTKEMAKRSFYKDFPSKYVCCHNDNQQIMAIIDYFEVPTYDGGGIHKSLTASINGGIEDTGYNVNIEVYNFGTTTEAMAAVPRLLAAWEAANNPQLISG